MIYTFSITYDDIYMFMTNKFKQYAQYYCKKKKERIS